MDRLCFEDIEELADKVYEEFCEVSDVDDDEYHSISVIAKYDEAKEIICSLTCIGLSIGSVELHPYDIKNYSDEYVITLYDDEVWCEEMKHENRYLDIGSDIIYVFGNCSSKAINHCKSDCVYEVSIGEDEEENNDDADVHGFSLSHTDDNGYNSFSYYTTNPLTEKDIREMVDKLGFSFSK